MSDLLAFSNAEFDLSAQQRRLIAGLATHGIRSAVRDGHVWAVATDLAAILGRRDAGGVVRLFGRSDRKLLPVKTSGGIQLQSTLRESALPVLLTRSRSAKARSLARVLGWESVHALPAEGETLAVIVAAFAGTPCDLERRVGPYRVDLHLPKLGIAVECDEFGHERYDAKQEAERQAYIERELGCTFVRYNPHDQGFNVGDVVSEILHAADLLRKQRNPAALVRKIDETVTKLRERRFVQTRLEVVGDARMLGA